MLLAYASFMNFILFHVDVKYALRNDVISEEIYFKQPLGFEDLYFPNTYLS